MPRSPAATSRRRVCPESSRSSTTSRSATQELHTFPFTGEQTLGFEGRKRRVRGYDPMLRRHGHAIVDGFASRGEADLMQEFAKRYPLVVIDDGMGLPVQDWEQLAGWARDILLGAAIRGPRSVRVAWDVRDRS